MTEGFFLYKGTWINKKNISHSPKLTKGEGKELLKRGGYLIRNTYHWDKKKPTSFWYVIKDDFGGIEELPTKVRNQVRRSQKVYEFRIVSYEEMIRLGYELFNKSRDRFDKITKITHDEWKQRISGERLEFWIGFEKVSNKPASFAINTIYDEYCDYTTMGFNPEFANSTYPIYGLIYEMNRYYLECHRVAFVCDGARSITEHSNIQSFLIEKFKFRKAYCDLQLCYLPFLAFAVKLLFPFRNCISDKKVSAILYQEAMARGLV